MLLSDSVFNGLERTRTRHYEYYIKSITESMVEEDFALFRTPMQKTADATEGDRSN